MEVATRRVQQISGHLTAGVEERKRVLVLGCGLVGSVLATDLCADHRIKVTVADVNPTALSNIAKAYPVLNTLVLDLSSKSAITTAARKFDLVAGALPSWLGFNALAAVIDAGKNYVDISFMAEDFTKLSEAAKAKKITAVCDCGVAPGMTHMACANSSKYFIGPVEQCTIYIGGIPLNPTEPFRYKAPFCPADVFHEYIRDSTVVIDGKITQVKALSDLETITLPKVPGGRPLEAFVTDGLRSLVRTLPAINMSEKTLRWPGHHNFVLSLREAGFLNKEPITVGSTTIAPATLTSELLLPHWKQNLITDPEFTIMRILMKGKANEKFGAANVGKNGTLTIDLFETTDTKSNPRRSSMARCTAYTCAVIVRLMLFGDIAEAGIECGVHPPEVIGFSDILFSKYKSEMEKRGIVLTQTLKVD